MIKGKEAKPHIGIFGRRNNGKSSIINRIAGQNIAIVSEEAGTTADPVKKSFEITGFGPVVLIDTAGIDDVGILGEKRAGSALDMLDIIDLAVLVVAENKWDEPEDNLVRRFKEKDIPFIVLYNKADITASTSEFKSFVRNRYDKDLLEFSAVTGYNHEKLIQLIRETIPEYSFTTPALLGDMVNRDDVVILVCPIDAEAPAGRLILPQVNAIRDLLDNHAVAVVMQEQEIVPFLNKMKVKPVLAVTDSQAFERVNALIPNDIPLTGFSIVLARYKGDFENYLKGTPKISELRDGDRILILESCSHHVSCEDIGRVKIPNLMRKFTGKKLDFDVVAGLDTVKRPVTDYALLVQCGGCMITRRQLFNRIQPAIRAGIPVTNYGMAIAYMHGIYDRAIAPFMKDRY